MTWIASPLGMKHMVYITFFAMVILVAIQGLLAFLVSHTRLLFFMRFEIMYPRLITYYYIHKYFLIISRKPFQQFVRCPNGHAFLLIIEQNVGPT